MTAIYDWEFAGDLPAAPRSRAATVVVTVQVALIGAILAIIFWANVDRTAQISSDGRYAPCGVVTEHGVTEHLDAFEARCNTNLDPNSVVKLYEDGSFVRQDGTHGCVTGAICNEGR